MMKMRDLNMETSLSVFLGSYISPEDRKTINEKYWYITVALELVNFPFALPGTKVYKAIQARKLVMRFLMAASAASKIRMADPNNEPDCLLDEWTRAMIQSRKGGNANADGEQARLLSREFSDKEIGLVIVSFLFASQDAMSSAIVYAFQAIADHPEVQAKIREEQYRIRGNDVNAPLTLDMVDDMVYTRACVKEVMRLYPSVIMVRLNLFCLSQTNSLSTLGSIPDQASFPDHSRIHRTKRLNAHPGLLELASRRNRLPRARLIQT